MTFIREENVGDVVAIRRVLECAFGRPNEAELVERLRQEDLFVVSLVALDGDELVGHILFTPVTIEAEVGNFEAVALGPLAVLPDYQRQGVGSALIWEGLSKCSKRGHSIVVVLGHSTYYPRFGFKPAHRYNIQCEFDVPDDVFMVIELREGALKGRQGIVRYHQAFKSV